MINETTWRTYLTPYDLEREKVLESFGVPMIRLNRFNLGKDPVATIDRMICERLAGLSNGSAPHEVVTKAADEAKEIEEGLKAGEYKRCKKCDRDLPLEMFRDSDAKSGLSRYCRDCKRLAHFAPAQRMRGWRAVLGPADVHGCGFEVDLLPAEVDHLRGPVDHLRGP